MVQMMLVRVKLATMTKENDMLTITVRMKTKKTGQTTKMTQEKSRLP